MSPNQPGAIVNEYATARAELSARRSDLLRRLTQIENDLERHGSSPNATERRGDAASIGASIVTDFIESLGREIALIESSLRRIDSREYDCCLQCGGTIQADRLERLPYSVNCTACSADFPVEYIHQLRSHHSSLRRTVFNVLHVLDDMARHAEARPGCDDTHATDDADVASALALLADLGRHLPARFEIEERGGYLAEALAAAPRFSRQATRLMAQHAEFSRRMDALVKDTEHAGQTPSSWTTSRNAFRQLALDLLAHEQAEADIVESAFLDDLGGID